jgi:hypothetical protein
MIDRSVYNLTYYTADTEMPEECWVRKCDFNRYAIINTKTGQKEYVTAAVLRKRFRFKEKERAYELRVCKRKFA